MCLNPRYILHPSLNRIFKRHTFDYAYFDGQILDVSHGLAPAIKYLKDADTYKLIADKDSNYVRDHYYLFSPDTGETHPLYFACPCGKCLDCARSRYGELSARLQFEVLSYPPECRVIFFTLTYNDRHLPIDGVSKSDVTDFINRLHIYGKRYGLGDGFRTFIVSEYGSDPRYTHRPHYHGLIFGLDLHEYGMVKAFNKTILRAWKRRGRLDWQFARSSHGVSKYCTKYVIKGLNEDFVPDGKNKNFISYPRKSGGLGVNALKIPEILDKVLNSTDGTITVKSHEYVEDGFTFGVSRIRIPRFIIDKLFPNFSRFIPSNIKRCCLWASQIWNVLKIRGYNDGVCPPVELEKFATYLRGFCFDRLDHLIDQPRCNTSLEKDFLQPRYKFGNCSTEQLFRIYNVIIAYLGAYKYTIDDALSAVKERQRYMCQIFTNIPLVSARDKIGDLSSFASRCYVTSELDSVFEL
ncbi:replication initiator protein [Peromfec virus RodF8_10]|uniref:Replication initiator protein n=1 Tax=Peromfec virus RodF8_10 TaxID=2929357 RepID=A0A976N1Z8_9VIRU|nr:replication initiator protein [Peromfec virus RodF8_10]